MKSIIIFFLPVLFVLSCKASSTSVAKNDTILVSQPLETLSIKSKEDPIPASIEFVKVAVQKQNQAIQTDTIAIVVAKTPRVENLPLEVEEPVQETLVEESAPSYPDHSLFDKLLKKHVRANGSVNYNGFKKNWSQLTAYIANLSEHLPTDDWSTNAKLAYWMNAYNAMTVDLILRHQPIESIKDIKDPWGQRFWKLGEKYYNLNEIEHDILRKMGDPRIHFGINCASFSCPPLLNKAFTEATVNKQLDILASTFINDPLRNTITKDAVEVSMIFKWFSKDFKTEGSLVTYLNKYAKTTISPKAKVRYKDYNWALNDL